MQKASRIYTTAGTKTVKVLAQDTRGLTSGWSTISYSCADNENSEGSSFTGTLDDAAQLELSIRATPSIVRSGNTTQLNWSATNVRSCTVTGSNGDTWDTIVSAIGGNTSKPITRQTTYTLACVDLDGTPASKSVMVRILPRMREL